MSVAEITREETRERAALLSVQGYEIELDVTRGEESFRSATTIRFTCASPGASTYVDLLAADAGRISSVTLNGEPLAPGSHFSSGRITLPTLADSNTLRVVADLEYSTPGFHRSTDPLDGRVYTYTKFEPDHARRVFACFEQPDLKGPFTISVIAPASWTVISTQPTPPPTPVSSPSVSSSAPSSPAPVARWDFPPTPPLSTYLMHVTAGEYHVVRSRHTTPRGQMLLLALACRASLSSALDSQAASLFSLTGAGLDYFTTLFDMDFPFAKYDQQFVPHYPAGATEHPAAVTLDEEFLFRSRATEAMHEQRAEVILHEMAHMWFGDYVTMQWWDDLWLNESFAEWAGYQAATSVTRFTGAWTTFAHSRKAWGYSTDLSPGTHAVAADVNTVSEALANFDGISYAKGASVLKQLIAFLGDDAFIRGLRAYFAEHAWGNTTLADFLRHLSTASGKDLTAWSSVWLRTARPNTLSAEFSVSAAGAFTAFAVRQEAQPEYPTLRPHHIGIGFYQRADGRLTRIHRVEVDVSGPLTVVPSLVGLPQPDLVLLNDGDLGYALIRFDERSQLTLNEAIGEFEDSLARAVCLSSSMLLATQGRLPLPDLFRLVASAMEAESSESVVQDLRRTIHVAVLPYMASPEWTSQGRAILAATAEKMLRAAEPGSDFQLAWAQLLADDAVTDGQLKLVEGLYQGTVELPRLEVTQQLRWRLLARLAATGRAGDADIDAEFARDSSDAGVRAARVARAWIPDAAHKQAAWDYLTGSAEPSPLEINEMRVAFRDVTDPALLAPFRDRYFEVLRRLWQSRKGYSRENTVLGLFPMAIVDERLFEQLDAFLAENKDADAGLVRAVLEARDWARRTAASRTLSEGA